MQHPGQILATSKTAAKMLDMRETEFLRLVEHGQLPGPVFEGRWLVEDIRRIVSGEAMRGNVEWA